MDKETIARHLGVDSGQIVSARPEDDGYRVLVDYGIGGIKVFHVPPSPEPAKASSPSQEPAKAWSPEPAKASSPVVVVSDKPVARKPVARAKTKR